MSSLHRLAFATLIVACFVSRPLDALTLRAEENDVSSAIAKFREQVAKAEGVSFLGRLRARSGGRAIQWLGSSELTILGVAGVRAEGRRLEVRDFRIDAVGDSGRKLAFFDGEKLRVADFVAEVVRSGDADWESLLGQDFGDLVLAVAGLPRDDRTLQIQRSGIRTIGVRRMLRFDAWLETPEQTAERLRKKPFVLRPRQTEGQAEGDAEPAPLVPVETYSGPAKVLTVGLDPDTGDLYRLELRETLGQEADGRESVRVVTLSFDPFRLLPEAPEDRLKFEVPERFPRENADWLGWSWEKAIETDGPASGGRQPSVEAGDDAP